VVSHSAGEMTPMVGQNKNFGEAYLRRISRMS
jgi:hypothetical protein